MVDAAERQSLIDRIVDLNGGGEALRALYSVFPDADLVAAVTEAEAMARCGRGTLHAKWRGVGDRILGEDQSQD